MLYIYIYIVSVKTNIWPHFVKQREWNEGCIVSDCNRERERKLLDERKRDGQFND